MHSFPEGKLLIGSGEVARFVQRKWSRGMRKRLVCQLGRTAMWDDDFFCRVIYRPWADDGSGEWATEKVTQGAFPSCCCSFFCWDGPH
jgi:nuclear transport factor 2 (NTF2) superfamily protein